MCTLKGHTTGCFSHVYNYESTTAFLTAYQSYSAQFPAVFGLVNLATIFSRPLTPRKTPYPAYPVLATDASHHGIGGTQPYLPPPPPLPSQLMQHNIARVGEAFPTMNAPPPTGQTYQTGPYRRTFAITLATNEPNCSKYIVDNASPYTLTGSLNHLYCCR